MKTLELNYTKMTGSKKRQLKFNMGFILVIINIKSEGVIPMP